MPVLAVRCLAIAGGAASVSAALQVACGAPPEHDIHLPGRTPAAAVSLPVGTGVNRAITTTVRVAEDQLADVTDVVTSSTRGIAAGRLSLAREDRIEHWIIDLTSESGLGTVTIP